MIKLGIILYAHNYMFSEIYFVLRELNDIITHFQQVYKCPQIFFCNKLLKCPLTTNRLHIVLYTTVQQQDTGVSVSNVRLWKKNLK